MQELVGDDYEVKNFGLSGSTLLSKGHKPYIESEQFKQLYEYAPEVVIIKLGTNDSQDRNWQYNEEFMTDYLKLIDTLKVNPKRKAEVIVCGPTPLYTDKESVGAKDSIIVNHVYPIVQQVAKKRNLVFVDTHEAFEGKAELFPDKIHPNAEGAERLAICIYNKIAQQAVQYK